VAKLRIKEKFKKSGYFWLPSAPERRIPGTLVITDGGNIELEVVGLFDESIEGLNRALNGKDELERIIGHIEKHGLVTLDDPSPLSMLTGLSLASLTIIKKLSPLIIFNFRWKALMNGLG
jgi:hypothetical protein